MKKIIKKINKLLSIKIPNNFFYKWIYFLKLKFYLYKLKRQQKEIFIFNTIHRLKKKYKIND